MELKKIKIGGQGWASIVGFIVPIVSFFFYEGGFWSLIAAGYAFCLFLQGVSFKIVN